MTFFVSISDKCTADAKQFGVTEYLQELASTIERDQAFWQLEAFEYPFWVKKRLGNRHTRLICRLESHQVGAIQHHVLVFLRVLQRGGREYEQLFVNIKKYGEELYRQVDHAEILRELNQRSQETALVPLPSPSQEENGFIYAVRSQYQHTELHHQRDMMYDCWSWVEQSSAKFEEEMLREIADRLVQVIGESSVAAMSRDGQTDVYLLGEYAGYRVLMLWFVQHQLSCLTLEAIDASANLPLSERHLSVEQLREAAQTTSFEQFQQMLSRMARRVYPQLVCLTPHEWLTVQHDQVANLALSPEEAEILSVAQRQERPFPLFINGRAGSGKSTILQCLFSDYLHYALQEQTQSQPIYFSCNQKLADRAAEMVWQIVQHSCRYHAANQQSVALTRLTLHSMRQYCVEFRQFLYLQLSDTERQAFAVGQLIEYGQFRQLWETKFGKQREAQQHYPASLCWHVIRCYIKGHQADDYLDPDDYAELGEDLRHVTDDLFTLIFNKVWLGWYQGLCKQERYWDDQDLVRVLLQHDRLQPQFPAIFCDEAQDFTRLELQAILRLNLFTGRSIDTHSIQRIPLVFAGDQFQTLNPTGFRWESIKAQVVEQFIFALDPAHQTRLSDISYRELTYNFRCSHPIAYFSNVIHGLRAKLFGLKQLQPQRSWHSHDGGRDVVFVDMSDQQLYLSLAKQYDLVFVVPCVDGEELEYLRKDPVLSVLIQVREHGGTSIPILSVNRAKGLEFSRVVMYGFAQDCPPELSLTRDNDWSDGQKIQVEYYLNRLYVAATRARSQLLLLDGAEDYQAFWSAFGDPLDEPLQLRQLHTEQVDWTSYLGRLRRAKLDDLTPDADQIRTMQRNAEQMQQQGWEQHDAYFLQQAAGLYQQLGIGYEKPQQHCLAQIDYLEQRFAAAAGRFLQVEQPEWAFESFWRAQDWGNAYLTLQQYTALATRPEREFLALMHQREIRAPNGYVQAAQSLLSQLDKLTEETAYRKAWQQIIIAVIARLPMDTAGTTSGMATGTIWGEVYRVSHRLDQHAYLHGQIHPSYLAEFAYLAGQMAEACQYWEVARAEHKIQPPTPRYEHAVIASRDFPDNLDALLKLQEYPQIDQAMQDHTDPNALSSKVWSAVFDALNQYDPNQLKAILAKQLPELTDLTLFELLIQKLQSAHAFNTLYKRVEQLKTLRSCTEGYWPLVQQALTQLLPTHQQLRSPEDMQSLLNLVNPNNKQKKQLRFQPDAKLVLILQGLARSEPYSRMVLEDRLNDTAQKIMSALKDMFQHTIPNSKPPTRHQKSYAKHLKVWRTQFSEARLLGAVLERSNDFTEALSFYEQLESSDDVYARQRWLACKLRQADHYYRMRDDFRRKANDAVDSSLTQDYERRAKEIDDRAEQYMKAAREQRKKLNFTAQDHLPEYPELTALSGLIQKLLNIQPIPPKPVRAAVSVSPIADTITDVVVAQDTPPTVHLPDAIVDPDTAAGADMPSDLPLSALPVELEPEAEPQQPSVIDLPDLEAHEPEELTNKASVADSLTVAILPVERSDTEMAEVDDPIQTSTADDTDHVKNTVETSVTDDVQSTAPALLPLNLDADGLDAKTVQDVVAPVVQESTHNTGQNVTRQTVQSVVVPSLTSNMTAALPVQPRPSTLPSLRTAAKLPKTELICGDYRLTFMRVQQRLNIEHQLTGEYASVFVQEGRVVGDWALQSLTLPAENDVAGAQHCYQLLGTPFDLHLPTAEQPWCVVEVVEHGLQLILR